METFLFSEPLPDLILAGKKTVTWRVGDERLVRAGDLISLCRTSGEEFARARVRWIKETTFRRLTPEDTEGHEAFSSPGEMYRTYSRYYRRRIGPETWVRVMKFRMVR